MEKNRRNFLKFTGLTGLGIVGANRLKGFTPIKNDHNASSINHFSGKPHKQKFNMCGYAAPKLETVRTGFIGLGQRGPTHMMNMTKLEGVEIKALCDIRPEYANRAKKRLEGTQHNPDVYTGSSDKWKSLCDRKDIDLVYIAAPWDMHTPMALYAMEQDKHVCIEVPAAVTLDQCWQLVETSERTRKHCMMLENDCYGFFQMLTLNMAREGFFGDIIHGEGAYIHNLVAHYLFNKNGYWKMWRLKQNARRNGNLYATHGLGPICQIMNINRGDKIDFITSNSSIDLTLGRKAKKLAAKDTFFAPYANAHYRGNMNTSTIHTNKGRTIMLQHNVSSPNVYSRIHKVVGTKGTAMEFPLPNRISDGGEHWLSEQELKSLKEKYQPPIAKRVGELAREVGGHGGKDFILDWRTIDLLHNGLPLDEDVYDAALWSSISPLSEASVANHSSTIDIPDFTCGSWKTNKPVDILLEKGGNTKVIV